LSRALPRGAPGPRGGAPVSAAGSEAPANGVPPQLAGDVRQRDAVPVHAAVAGMRIELAVEVFGNLEGDRAVASRNLPVAAARRSRRGVNPDAAVARARADAGER